MPCLLFICTANICRSPVAEGLTRQRLEKEKMAGWMVASAGTWAMQQRGAADNSLLLLAEREIDMRAHQAQMVDEPLLARADLVLCMAQGHVEALQAEFPQHAYKIYLLSAMTGRRFSVADPYGQDLDAYRHMVREVDQLIEQGWPNIVALAQENAAGR